MAIEDLNARQRRVAVAGVGAVATVLVRQTAQKRNETFGLQPVRRPYHEAISETRSVAPIAEDVPEEGKSRWLVILAYGLLAAATQALLVNYAPVTHDAARHFGVSVAAIGWLSQVFPLIYVLLAIPVGLILDRFFIPALGIGAVLTVAGAFLRLVADNYHWALIGQSVAALGQPFVLNGITGLAVVYLAKKDRTTGIALASAATFGGMFVGYLLGACMPGERHIHTLTLVTAMIAMDAGFAFLGALYFIRPLAGADAIPATNGLRAIRAAFGNRHLRRLCAVVVIPMGTFIALATYAQPLLEPAGVSETSAGLILAITLIIGVIGCSVVPVLAEKLGKEVQLMGAGIAVTAGACLHLAIIPSTAMAWIMLLGIGFALLPALPIVLALTEKHAPEAEGTAAGLIWLAGNLGGVVVAVVVGILVNHAALAFVVLAGVTSLALPALRWYRRLDAEAPSEEARIAA